MGRTYILVKAETPAERDARRAEANAFFDECLAANAANSARRIANIQAGLDPDAAPLQLAA